MKRLSINKTWAVTGGVVALTAAIALFAPVKPASAAYSSPVTVLNTNTGPVPVVAQDALQSFSTSINLATSGGVGVDSSIVVPTGKRLVLEYISVQGTTDVGQRIQDVLIETTTPGKGGVSGIPTLGVYPVQNGTLNSKPNWVASQPILAYADAGTVTLQTDITGGSQTNVFVTLSGHFVSIQ